MKVYISGTRNGEAWPPPGGEITVGDAEGADLCANGLAEPVAKKEKVETAVDREPVEERTEPAKRRGRPPKSKS